MNCCTLNSKGKKILGMNGKKFQKKGLPFWFSHPNFPKCFYPQSIFSPYWWDCLTLKNDSYALLHFMCNLLNIMLSRVWWAPISHASCSMPLFSSLLLNVGEACDLLPPTECSSSDVPNPGLGHSLADPAFVLLGTLSSYS